MYKIFKLQYEKFLSRFIMQEESKLINLESLTNFYRKYIPNDILLLKKHPISDIRNIARMECYVDGARNEYVILI